MSPWNSFFKGPFEVLVWVREATAHTVLFKRRRERIVIFTAMTGSTAKEKFWGTRH